MLCIACKHRVIWGVIKGVGNASLELLISFFSGKAYSLSPCIPLVKLNESSSACKYRSSTARLMGDDDDEQCCGRLNALGGCLAALSGERLLLRDISLGHWGRMLWVHSCEQKAFMASYVTLHSFKPVWHITANTDHNSAASQWHIASMQLVYKHV